MANPKQLTDKVAPSMADPVSEQYADAFVKATGQPLEDTSPEIRELFAEAEAAHNAAHQVMATYNDKVEWPSHNMSSRIISDNQDGTGWYGLMTDQGDENVRHIVELSDDLSIGKVFCSYGLIDTFRKV